MPARFAAVGDRHAGIDEHAVLARRRCSSSRRATRREGLGDAPWPPHYEKQAGEPPRVQPSKRRRAPKHPLIEIGRRAARRRTRWPGSSAGRRGIRRRRRTSQPADVLVDAMRGRFRTWTRIRVNLQHVPEELRPAQEPLDPDEDP